MNLKWYVKSALAFAVVMVAMPTMFVSSIAVAQQTSTENPYDSSGKFIGYSNPWPANCIYVIPGLPTSESGTTVRAGRQVFNPTDRNSSTTAPLCYPENVSAYNFSYFGRGVRMRNVGTAIDKNGCAQKFKADGSYIGLECFNIQGGAYGEGSGDSAGSGDVVTAESEATFPVGWIDSVSCDGITGWVYDSGNTSATSSVHLYVNGKVDSGQLVASAATTETREDVNNLFKISGSHGFKILIPDSLRDGQDHSVYVYGIDTDGSDNRALGGGGRVFNCSGTTGVNNTPPQPVPITNSASSVGWFDSADAKRFVGWAFDPDNTTASIDVHFYANAPADKGGVLVGYTKTNLTRTDVNNLYGITGTHGFLANLQYTQPLNNFQNEPGVIVVPATLRDGKSHDIYAYAIDSNGGKNPFIGGSPRKVVFTSTTGSTGSTGNTGDGSGAGVSSRHNYLTPCEGNGLAGENDPAIAIVVAQDGTITATVNTNGAQDVSILVGGKAVSGSTFTLNPGDSVTVNYKGGSYTADSEGLKPGDTVSILVPMPCIRIGYNDILGGQQCGDGEGGTCADELDAFIDASAMLNLGFKENEFEIWYKVVGGDYDTKGWKKYDWKNCGQYTAHCIRLKGAGTIHAQYKALSSVGNIPSGHASLTNIKAFDVPNGKF